MEEMKYGCVNWPWPLSLSSTGSNANSCSSVPTVMFSMCHTLTVGPTIVRESKKRTFTDVQVEAANIRKRITNVMAL